MIVKIEEISGHGGDCSKEQVGEDAKWQSKVEPAFSWDIEVEF